MDVFRDAWIQQVKVLTEAVDDITTVDDFLAVSGKIQNYRFLAGLHEDHSSYHAQTRNGNSSKEFPLQFVGQAIL